MKPIAVGDLVQVVKPTPCCGTDIEHVGHVFRVTGFQMLGFCKFCDFRHGHRSIRGHAHGSVREDRLKRIPPLDELEGVKTEETLKEPA